MLDESGVERQHQSKVIEMLEKMREELVYFSNTLYSGSTSKTPDAKNDSVASLILTIDILMEESKYLFEISSCKQLMLIDKTEHIKRLEKDLAELTLRKS